MDLTEWVSDNVSRDLADKLPFYFFLSSIDLSGSRKSAGLRRILGGGQSKPTAGILDVLQARHQKDKQDGALETADRSRLNRRFSYIICGNIFFTLCNFSGIFGVFRVYSAFSLRNCRFYA